INFANLVFSYTPTSIERQYATAKFYLAPSTQAAFADIFFKQEIPVVKTTGTSQMFIIDPLKAKVEREKSVVKVTLGGERIRILAGRETRHTMATTEIVLRTFPHNNLNPQGILVVDFKDLRDAER
ncbi:MAG: type IV conjugative transfer system protein TraE, partial [Deltaproteobacteria bacterium]|nr:type IV conjugative transfer system protein TraE [Deltaproteobacteria bacterium]